MSLGPGGRRLQKLLDGAEKGGSRVIHVVPELFGAVGGLVGGAERYAYELARHMAERVPTTLLSFGPEGHVETVGGLEVRRLRTQWDVQGQRANPLALGLFRACHSAALVHFHQQFVLASSLGALYCRLIGTPAVVTNHGGGALDLSQYMPTKRIFRRHLHVSEYSRATMRQEHAWWSQVIWGGVDLMKFAGDAFVTRRRAVLYVGRILPHKGVNYLIEALPPELELDIVGPAHDERYLADLRALVKGKTVRFHHDVDDKALVAFYRQALCIVLPSVYRTVYGDELITPELLGQTLLEGMACGLPAICTAVGPMPEVVSDGVTGFVVPPNDASALRAKLAWLGEHPSEAAEMGRKGRQRVEERFTWPQVVGRCLEVYRTLT